MGYILFRFINFKKRFSLLKRHLRLVIYHFIKEKKKLEIVLCFIFLISLVYFSSLSILTLSIKIYCLILQQLKSVGTDKL